MQSLSPNIFVSNMTATIDFYTFLGFSVIMTVPDQTPSPASQSSSASPSSDQSPASPADAPPDPQPASPIVWAMLASGPVSLMFQTFESLGEELPAIRREDGGSLLLYINVADINSLFNQVKDKVTVLKGLERTFYGAIEFSILDPNNYVLTFAQHDHQ